MLISWWLCNNSEIHLSLWKVWSLVVCSQKSFYVTRAREDDKNRQNTFFLCWIKMSLVPNEQLILNVPFQSNKFGKKELSVDNKVQESIGDVYCPTRRTEKFDCIPTYKRLVSTTGEKCVACCSILKVPFKNYKLSLMLFCGDGTHCFARKTSRDNEKEKPFPFLKSLRQSQLSTSEPEPKKVKMSSKKE